MEVFYCFYLGPVAVAGIITDSRKKNGEIISPVNKSKEIKPGVLLNFIGPYEDNMEYLNYFQQRYDRYPDMEGDQVVEDFRVHIGLEEIDAQSFMKLMTDAVKNGHKWSSVKQAQVMEELQSHPMNKIINEKPPSIEGTWNKNKTFTQFDVIEATSKGFSHYRGAVSDFFVRYLEKYLPGDVCHFHFSSIPIDDSSNKDAGQHVLDIIKKTKQYIPQAKKNCPYGATILKSIINEFHYLNIVGAQPLQFLQVGPHTDYRWIPKED